MNCPTNHQRVTLHTKYNSNPYETTERGECQDCGANLDSTDIPEGAEVRDEYGRLVEVKVAHRASDPETESMDALSIYKAAEAYGLSHSTAAKLLEAIAEAEALAVDTE